MISFDNGPAGGDYVRYIDKLMANAAKAAQAGVLMAPDLSTSSTNESIGAVRARLAALAALQVASQTGRGADRPMNPVVATNAYTALPTRSSGRSPARDEGFDTQQPQTMTQAAASAAASALMSGQVAQRVSSMRINAGLIMLVFGLGLLGIGIAQESLALGAVVPGFVIAILGVRLLSGGVRKPARMDGSTRRRA
jgi:hypothetical protein